MQTPNNKKVLYMLLTLGGAEVEGESRSRRDGAGDKSNQKVIKQEERMGVFRSLERTAT